MKPLRVGSLFAGIGGFDLGLERTGGFENAWFCEQDEFCQKVLAKHWPDSPCHPDVRTIGAHNVAPVDVLCGGFPCQDISLAGKGAGIEGSRSGLWTEYARLIGELRPRYVLVENVPALLSRGLGTVLSDMAAVGYDAEWDCLPASAFGAPHRRDRIWLVAYPRRVDGRPGREGGPTPSSKGQPVTERALQVADPDHPRRSERRRVEPVRAEQPTPERSGEAMADAHGLAGAQGGTREGRPGEIHQPGEVKRTLGRGGIRGADEGRTPNDPNGGRHGAPKREVRPGWDGAVHSSRWLTEPDVGRVADGIPARVDRLRSLGNALVPPIAEWLGHRVLEAERVSAEAAAASTPRRHHANH